VRALNIVWNDAVRPSNYFVNHPVHHCLNGLEPQTLLCRVQQFQSDAIHVKRNFVVRAVAAFWHDTELVVTLRLHDCVDEEFRTLKRVRLQIEFFLSRSPLLCSHCLGLRVNCLVTTRTEVEQLTIIRTAERFRIDVMLVQLFEVMEANRALHVVD